MPRTILVVDDSELCRKALAMVLSTVPDLEVHLVESAELALVRLAANQFCALITDLNLPQMDGFELIRTVRAQLVRGQLPILVISGDGHPQTSARVFELGADAFLEKPFSPQEVRAKLQPLIPELFGIA